jgi:hypothetical protein
MEHWLKSIPDWVWLLLGLSVVIIVVADRIDERLQRMEGLLCDLHDHFVEGGEGKRRMAEREQAKINKL